MGFVKWTTLLSLFHGYHVLQLTTSLFFILSLLLAGSLLASDIQAKAI